MVGFWLPVLILAGYALVMLGLSRLGSRAQRRGVGGSVLGAFDEIWHPAGYRPRAEIQLQAQRKIPLPEPGDGPWCGRIRIDLP